MGAREKLEEAKAKRNARDAARRAATKAQHAEAGESHPHEEDEKVKVGGAEIFKNQKGLPANVKAKELAKAKAKKKTEVYPVIYTQKGLKVVKLIIKPGKTVSVYVGNMSAKKHKMSLEPMIKKWTAEGLWFREHEAKEHCSKIQAEYAEKAKAE